MDTKTHPPEDDWRRQWTVPEEDLPHCITSKRKPGEHRWFRSPNVICLEEYRRMAMRCTDSLARRLAPLRPTDDKKCSTFEADS
jgi:hypothetical protein